MAIALTVNGQVYDYPENRDDPGWGEEASSWAEAVTAVLAVTFGLGDILQTSASLSNGVAVATNIPGFFFNPLVVRGAVCEYSIYRKSTGVGATELLEVGTAYLAFKTVANAWELTQVGTGTSGITLTITAGGQVQYVSTSITGTGPTGTMKFRARALTI